MVEMASRWHQVGEQAGTFVAFEERLFDLVRTEIPTLSFIYTC